MDKEVVRWYFENFDMDQKDPDVLQLVMIFQSMGYKIKYLRVPKTNPRERKVEGKVHLEICCFDSEFVVQMESTRRIKCMCPRIGLPSKKSMGSQGSSCAKYISPTLYTSENSNETVRDTFIFMLHMMYSLQGGLGHRRLCNLNKNVVDDELIKKRLFNIFSEIKYASVSASAVPNSDNNVVPPLRYKDKRTIFGCKSNAVVNLDKDIPFSFSRKTCATQNACFSGSAKLVGQRTCTSPIAFKNSACLIVRKEVDCKKEENDTLNSVKEKILRKYPVKSLEDTTATMIYAPDDESTILISSNRSPMYRRSREEVFSSTKYGGI